MNNALKQVNLDNFTKMLLGIAQIYHYNNVNWSLFDGEAKSIEKFFSLLRSAYSNQRWFHTLHHIDYCLNLFEEMLPLLQKRYPQHGFLRNPDLIRCALWYHDFVYIPGNNSNEILSALVARHVVYSIQRTLTPAEEIEKIILATDHATYKDGKNMQLSGMIAHDIDLSTLAVSKEEFKENREKIKNEFRTIQGYTENTFQTGTSKFAEDMLNREKIFILHVFQKKFEKQARKNLKTLVIKK